MRYAAWVAKERFAESTKCYLHKFHNIEALECTLSKLNNGAWKKFLSRKNPHLGWHSILKMTRIMMCVKEWKLTLIRRRRCKEYTGDERHCSFTICVFPFSGGCSVKIIFVILVEPSKVKLKGKYFMNYCCSKIQPNCAWII